MGLLINNVLIFTNDNINTLLANCAVFIEGSLIREIGPDIELKNRYANHKSLDGKGKLLIPVGKMFCELTLIEKKGEEIISKNLGGCVFVPLVGKYGH